MRFRAALLALLLAAAAHLAVATPAAACSCISPVPGEKQFVDRADAIFVAELAGYTAPPQRATMSSMDPAVWTFTVSAVYKGEVAARQDVVSAMDSASCGLELPRGGRFLVYAGTTGDPATRLPGPVLYSGLCQGTRSLDGPAPAELGTPRPPIPGVRAAVVPKPATASAVEAPEAPVAMPPAPAPAAVKGRANPPNWVWPLGILALVAALIAGIAIGGRLIQGTVDSP